MISSFGQIASANNSNLSTISLTGLTASTYTITITDTVTNCTDIATAIVEAPTEEAVVAETVVADAVAEAPVVTEAIVETSAVEEPLIEEAVVEETLVEETAVEETVVETRVSDAVIVTAPVVVPQQPVVAHPEGVVFKHYASAPMTKAPAPNYAPESPTKGQWERPAFDFAGKGSAGGHAAATQATAPATKPQSVE